MIVLQLVAVGHCQRSHEYQLTKEELVEQICLSRPMMELKPPVSLTIT